MGTTTMGVKLDDATRERIKSAATRIDRTPHWLITVSYTHLHTRRWQRDYAPEHQRVGFLVSHSLLLDKMPKNGYAHLVRRR